MTRPFADTLNERFGPRRFKGPSETIDACLFRNRITVRRGDGKALERAWPDLETARERWHKLTREFLSTGHEEVRMPPDPRVRTLVLQRETTRLTLQTEGASIFETREPPLGFPTPAPLYSLFSHEHALEEVEQLAQRYEASGYRRVADEQTISRQPRAVLPGPDRVAGEPQVRTRARSVVLDLAEARGDWSSLADLIQTWGAQRDAKKIREVVLRADATLDDHSLAPALDALASSPVGPRLLGLCLEPADSEGRPLPLGDVSRAWQRFPKLERLKLDCDARGQTTVGTLDLPRLQELRVVLNQPEHLRAITKTKAPRLASVRVEFTNGFGSRGADARALWRWLGSLKLKTLELEGPFIPTVVEWLDESPWLAGLRRLELIANNGLGEPMDWPSLEPAPSVLAKIPAVVIRDSARAQPLIARTRRPRKTTRK